MRSRVTNLRKHLHQPFETDGAGDADHRFPILRTGIVAGVEGEEKLGLSDHRFGVEPNRAAAGHDAGGTIASATAANAVGIGLKHELQKRLPRRRPDRSGVQFSCQSLQFISDLHNLPGGGCVDSAVPQMSCEVMPLRLGQVVHSEK